MKRDGAPPDDGWAKAKVRPAALPYGEDVGHARADRAAWGRLKFDEDLERLRVGPAQARPARGEPEKVKVERAGRLQLASGVDPTLRLALGGTGVEDIVGL